MALSYPQQPNFSRGVITPKLYARYDLDQFRLALRDAENVLVLRHGSLCRRSGTQFVGDTALENNAVRLLEFIFDREQAYVLEMGSEYFRFLANGGYVESGGNPYEVVHDYTVPQLPDVSYVQNFDTMFFAHSSRPPATLRRIDETDWEFDDFDFQDGPYDPLNTTATTLDPSAVTGAVTILASSIVGINDGVGFRAADVGRWVRMLYGTTWYKAQITAINSTTSVNALIVGDDLSAHTAITTWRLGTWYEGNYPSKVGLYQDRLVWASTPLQPSTIWLSAGGIFEEYGTSLPQVDTDPLTFEISGATNIEWLAELDDLLYGTPQNARAIGPSDRGGPITAATVAHRKGQRIGASSVRPVLAGSAVLYANAYGTSVREMTYSYDADSYVQPEATILSEHLLRSGIGQMAFAQEPEPTVWMTVSGAAGQLVSMVYDPEQKMLALMPHRLAPATDDEEEWGRVQSMAAIPGADGWEVWLIVRRIMGGVTKRTIEFMRQPFRDDDEITDAFFVDCGLEYEGAAASVIGGFDHLIGQTVSVLVDGAHHPQVVVNADGEIELDREGTKVVAGLPMGAYFETLEIPQQQDGSLRGRKRRLGSVFVDLLNSGPVDISQQDLPLERVGMRNADDNMDAPPPLFTGVYEVKPESAWDKEARIIVSADEELPLPFFVRAVTPAYEAEP
jgi:hypothetical protein